MKQQLNSLRHYITTHLENDVNTTSFHPTDALWITELPLMKEEILLQLKSLVLSKKPDRLIKRHIRHTQRECINLLNLLPESEQQVAGQSLQQVVKACLDDVLEYLFESHGYHLDQDVYAAVNHVSRKKTVLTNNNSLLAAGLKRKKVAPELHSIITDACNRFLTLKKVTYHQLHYIEKLQTSLIRFCNQISNTDSDDLLIAHLVYFGFNDTAFLGFCKHRINQQLNQLYQVAERYERLCFLEKCLLAQQEKAGFIFNNAQLSAKTQLFDFVKAELHYFKRKSDFIDQKARILHPNTALASTYRLKFNLSADSLAYLMRLLCEAEVIEASPRTQLMEFAARNFQTSGIGDKLLSAPSLGTKYKQVTQRTAQGLKVLLRQMLKQLDTDFGRF